MKRKTLIEVKGLTKRFDKVTALDGVSLIVEEGEVLSLIGPSGCGKTTILRNIAGLDRADEGEIVIDGKVVYSAKKNVFVDPEKRNVGLVFQSYALWPSMTVEQNVIFGLKARKFPGSDAKTRASKALERVGLLGYEKRYPSQLSGGQQQRVALARCIAYEPAIVLLDEPLSNLDLRERERVRVEIKKLLKSTGITALYVTHDQEEAFTLSERVMIMNKGRIIQEGSPRQLYEDPKELFVASFVGKSNILDASLKRQNGGDGMLTVEGLGVPLRCDHNVDAPDGKCSLIVRPNEISLSTKKEAFEENVLHGKVVDRDYRGSMTDHRVVVGAVELTVTTHRFCNRSESTDSDEVYLSIPKRGIIVIPLQAKNPP